MWFLPFVQRSFPNFHFIYAVRDVRDLLNPKTSFTEHDTYWVQPFFLFKGQVGSTDIYYVLVAPCKIVPDRFCKFRVRQNHAMEHLSLQELHNFGSVLF